MHRPVNEIQNDYSRVCAQLGHLEYQLFVIGKDTDRLKKELEALNLEAAAATAAAASEAKAEEKSEPVEEKKEA